MRVLEVPLPGRNYRIHVGTRLLPTLGRECTQLELGQRCAVISDTQVAPRYAEATLDSLRSAGFEPVLVRVPSGERAKNLEVVARCYDRLAAHRLERRSFIVALGGGVVGDLAGFVAASYLRGIPFVQLPTTLLAQVDSSVGGKVGVNLKAGKNLVGAFHQPKLVLCDLDTLSTLPPREYRAGLAEVIKYGIIDDARLFRRLEKSMGKLLEKDPHELEPVVARCCEIKAAVVLEDEKETGRRAILNFGHTIGHGIEASVGYGRYRHGEAISIGQVAAAKLSVALAGLTASESDRIRHLFERAGLPVALRLSERQFKELTAAMRLDKKVTAGSVRFVLSPKLGQAIWGQEVPEELIRASLGLSTGT